MKKAYFAKVLEEELRRRKEKNRRYSMRAFADSIGVHPSALSRILTEKEDMSSKAALSIANKLNLDPKAKRLFLKSVVDTREAKERKKLGAASGIPELRPQLANMSTSAYSTIFNLDAHALLQLTQTRDFNSDPKQIASRLKLSVTRVKEILEALEKLQLITVDAESGGIKIHEADFMAVQKESTDASRKKHQVDILERAIHSVQNVEFDSRASYSVSTAIDPKKLPQAREMILRFMETLVDFLEQDDRAEVYQLNFNLYPLSFPIEEPK